jgi:hypothetical protein
MRHSAAPFLVCALACAMALLLGACGSGPRRSAEVLTTPSSSSGFDPAASFSRTEPVSIQAAFTTAKPVRQGQASTDIQLGPGVAPLVKLNTQTLLVVPVVSDGVETRQLKLRSFIVRLSDGSYAMFYPIVSLVDENFEVVRTLKPEHEFAFDGNTLLNTFELPAATKRLLIHTDEEFFRSAFRGSTLQIDRSRWACSEMSNASVAPVTLALMAVCGVQAGTRPASRGNATIEFRFSEIGVLRVEGK